jgi:PAP2 superfamily
MANTAGEPALRRRTQQMPDYDSAITRGVLFPAPPNAYAPTSGEPFILRPWLRAFSEGAFIVLLIVFLILGAYLSFPAVTTVLEQDPSYSYPVEVEDVSSSQLFITVTCVPLGIAIVVHVASLISALYLQGLLRKRVASDAAGMPLSAKELAILQIRRERLFKQHLKAFAWFLLCYAECFLLIAAITTSLKKIFAYPRPNAFALCNYKGYADALSSGNTAAYLGSTSPFTRANFDANCQSSSTSDKNSALEALISGHASISFALLGLLTLYLRAVFGVPTYNYISLPSFFCAFPLIIAAWFAISRVRNRWHRPEVSRAENSWNSYKI